MQERQERIVDCTHHSHTHMHKFVRTLSQLSLKDDDDVTPVILLPNITHKLLKIFCLFYAISPRVPAGIIEHLRFEVRLA